MNVMGLAWLGSLYHIVGCVVGAGQGLFYGLFRGSFDMNQHQRASTWAAFQKHAPGLLSKLYFVAGCVVGLSQGIWLGLSRPNCPKKKVGLHYFGLLFNMFHRIPISPCPNFEAGAQRGSGRACPKTPKHGKARHTPFMGFKHTTRKLFALFNSSRSSSSAARSGTAAEAYSPTWLSFLQTSCSRIAAALAAQFSCKATGAGYAASSAAHAAEPNLVSGDGTGKSANRSRSPSYPHESTQDNRPAESPDEPRVCQAKELFALGVQAADQDDYVRALDLYNEGLKLSSADKKLNASLHNNKGGALVALRRYALAIVECCKAIDLDEDLWHPYLLRHLAWKRVGVYTKAAEDLVVVQAKGGPCKQHLIRDVARADSVQYSTLLGLSNNGKPLGKRDVTFAYRELMRECHPDKAPDDQRHKHQRHVAHMLAQHINFARDKLIASL